MGAGVEEPLKPLKTGLVPFLTGYLLGRPHFERSEIVWHNLKWKTSGPKKKCAACASLRLVILRSLLESQGASSIFRVGIEACKSRVFAYSAPILRRPLFPASSDLWNTQNLFLSLCVWPGIDWKVFFDVLDHLASHFGGRGRVENWRKNFRFQILNFFRGWSGIG